MSAWLWCFNGMPHGAHYYDAVIGGARRTLNCAGVAALSVATGANPIPAPSMTEPEQTGENGND